jgi:hypothetical protein
MLMQDGLFSSGGSICPDTIIPGSCVCTSSAPGTSSAVVGPQGDAVLAASVSGDSGAGSSVRPELIALLVLNAVMLVIIFVLGAMLVRARRAAGPSSRPKVLYTGLDGPRFVSS